MFLTILIVAFVIGMMALVVNEQGLIAFFVLVAFCILVEKAFIPFLKPIWFYVIANPLSVVGIVIGYIIIGVLWSFFKWFWFLKGKKAAAHYTPGDLTLHYKVMLMRWVGYWPISLSWDVIQFPVTKLWRWVYDLVADAYRSIESKALNKN